MKLGVEEKMLDFNSNLNSSLELLYNYSKNFELSIDLIQKLSQQLKLDTFIDTDAYAHILDQALTDENSNPIKFQRLSIAGSLILIDVDFVGSTIYRVSFSLANQLDDDNINPNNGLKNPLIDTQLPIIVKQDDFNVVNLDFSKNPHSLLNKNIDNNIEDILLANLKTPTLNNFPANLKYLANLDRLSNSQIDLFNYNNNIALILQTLYNIEINDLINNDQTIDNRPDGWLLKHGLINSIGKILIHNGENNQIGVFIEFWKDFRYINHEYELETGNQLLGKSYNVLLNMTGKNSHNSIDYISDVREHIWELSNGGKYQLQFNDDSYLVPSRGSSAGNGQSNYSIDFSRASPDWVLSLLLNHFIYLPINLLEFIGICDFDEESDNSELNELFEKLNNEKELSLIFEGFANEDKDLKATIKSEIHSKYVPVNAITIKKLVDVPSFLMVFRNHLVLTNLLKQLNEKGKLWQDNDGNKITVEAKNKLKQSLKLSSDITDDKILSLGALNDHHRRQSQSQAHVQTSENGSANINVANIDEEDEDISLDEFMEENFAADEKPSDNQIHIKINDISYSLKQVDVFISITGKFNNRALNIPFTISNGEIIPNNLDPNTKEDMIDEDDINNNLRFVKCLNLTEDLLKSLSHTFA